jgi:hypothetical protein
MRHRANGATASGEQAEPGEQQDDEHHAPECHFVHATEHEAAPAG